MKDLPEHGLLPWTETTKAVLQCASEILKVYGKIQIRFINSLNGPRSIRNIQSVGQMLQSASPDGRRSVFEILDEYLNEYRTTYKNVIKSVKLDECESSQKLNLIVFTNKAHEDFFNESGRLSLLGRCLDILSASDTVRRIHFVQICNLDDHSALKFSKAVRGELKSPGIDEYLKSLGIARNVRLEVSSHTRGVWCADKEFS